MERTAGGQAIVMGVILILIGTIYLAVEFIPRLRDIDVAHYGWPVFVIVPGLVLIGVAGAVPEASGLCVPGGIVVMAGLVLGIQNIFNLFATATYTWALVAPGGVGLGLWLQGLVNESPGLRITGAQTLGAGFIVFLFGALFFESITHVSGVSFPLLVRLLLPLLFIVVGITVVARRSLPTPAR
ncbi:MAG: hypothetical protein E6J41_00235 [Chloroflexi bacterium]|nr:MAG: hypothetical protein E6J41_00235 [Chloroflexota bacterium]